MQGPQAVQSPPAPPPTLPAALSEAEHALMPLQVDPNDNACTTGAAIAAAATAAVPAAASAAIPAAAHAAGIAAAPAAAVATTLGANGAAQRAAARDAPQAAVMGIIDSMDAVTFGDPTSTPLGAMASKRVRRQDASGRLALEPRCMAIEPAVPNEHLPRRHWPPSYHVLTERGMVALDGKGSSEVIEHDEYATEVDNYNILARIPYLGLRIPLKCFRAWRLLTKATKFARARSALAVGALGLRPRAVRIQRRVCEILMAAEDAALDEGVHLLPPAAVDGDAMRDAGPRAPTTLELDAIVDAHCEGLRERVRALYARIASVVDEEWEPLNWTQEAAPVEETLESQARRLEEQKVKDSIASFERRHAAHVAATAAAGSGPGLGSGPAATNPSSSPAHTPQRPSTAASPPQGSSRAPRGVASTMAPPPEGGYGHSMVEWRPNRLTQARIKPSATRGLPKRAVERLQRAFSYAQVSTGGASQAAKQEAKHVMEVNVASDLRALRAKCERRELAKLLRICDARLQDCTGRLIWMGMRDLLRQLEMVIGAPLDVDLPPSDADATLAAIDPDRLDDARPPRSRRALADRRGATRLFPSRLLALRASMLVSSHDQREAALDLAPSLVTRLLTAALERAVAALQPPGRLGHLKPMQRLLERTTGNYYPAPPPPPPPRPTRPIERVHELLSASQHGVVEWSAVHGALLAAVARSFELAAALGGRALARRAAILRSLLTPEQREEARLRAVRAQGSRAATAAKAAEAAEAAEAPAAHGEARPPSPRFDGLVGLHDGSEAAWDALVARVDAEMAAASAWERFARESASPHWARAGLLQLDTSPLTSPRVVHLGVALSPAQLSGPTHANALLRAGRLLAQAVAHRTQQRLVTADLKPRALAEHVGALRELALAKASVDEALEAPRRLEALHALVARHGVAVPAADATHVAQLRAFCAKLRETHAAMEGRLEASRGTYTEEALSAATTLASDARALVKRARRRGVFNEADAQPSLVAPVAADIAARLEGMEGVDVPRLATWLRALHQEAALGALAPVGHAATDVRTCATAWARLGEWRDELHTLLTTPLVKLQARDGALDGELESRLADVAALDAAWRDGTGGGASDAAGSRVAGEAPPGDGGDGDGGDGDGGGGGDSGEPSWRNRVLERLSSELDVWRAALPLVHMLLHPRMRTAQWQRIYAHVPPPKEKSKRRGGGGGDAPAAATLGDGHSAALGVDELVRRKAAEEMASLRAPGSMALEALWEHGLESFRPVIERVLKQTLRAQQHKSSPAMLPGGGRARSGSRGSSRSPSPDARSPSPGARSPSSPTPSASSLATSASPSPTHGAHARDDGVTSPEVEVDGKTAPFQGEA